MLTAIQMHSGSDVSRPELDNVQFLLWTSLLEKRLGIAMTEKSRAFLSSQLRMRMRELDITGFNQYYELVISSQHGAKEWSVLLDRLTIHETRFNRQPASFRLIEEIYLPQLLQRSRGAINLKGWSVGCASGEEAYYMAMLFDRALSAYTGKAYFGVFGTDVSLESLSQARSGIYAGQRLQQLGDDVIKRYFEQDGQEYRVVDSLRKRVAFSQLNVLNLEQAPFDGLDIVFCQNLLIYFSQQKRRQIVTGLTRFLKPGGIMILGVGEITGWKPEGLETLKHKDTLAYQKALD